MSQLFSLSSVKKIFKSTAIYAGGNVINRALPFILLPVLTRFLSPKDYGILATFIAILGIVYTLIYMGTIDAILRAYYEKRKEGFNFSQYVFNAIFISFLVALFILFIWLLLKEYFIRIIPIPFRYQLMIPVVGFAMTVCGIASNIWVAEKKPTGGRSGGNRGDESVKKA